MNDRCTYCDKLSGDEPFRNAKGLPVCNGCTAKGGLLLLKFGTALLFLKPKRKPKKPKPKYRLNPNAKPKPKPKPKPSKKRKKKMKRFSQPFTVFLCVMAFAAGGFTVRCDTDDDKDKDKDKSAAFVDIHGHDIQEAVSDALPGALVNFEDPDYACMAIGSIDREGQTDFDVLFITGCHKQ